GEGDVEIRESDTPVAAQDQARRRPEKPGERRKDRAGEQRDEERRRAQARGLQAIPQPFQRRRGFVLGRQAGGKYSRRSPAGKRTSRRHLSGGPTLSPLDTTATDAPDWATIQRDVLC